MTSQHDRTLLQGLAVGSSARSEGEAGRVHGQLTLLHSLSGHLPRFPSVSLGERVCHSVCTQAAIWSCLLHGFLVCSSPSWSWHGQPLSVSTTSSPPCPLRQQTVQCAQPGWRQLTPGTVPSPLPPVPGAWRLTAGHGGGPPDSSLSPVSTLSRCH